MRTLCAGTMVLLLTAGMADAASRYWIATSDAAWSDTANWSTTSGGAGGASVPAGGDTAIFDGAGSATGNCAVSTSVTLQGIKLLAGYSGTVDAGANDVLTTGDSFWEIHNGRFRSTSGVVKIAGAITITTNGVLEKTAGTVMFSVLGNRTFNIYPGQTGRTQEFHNVVLTNNQYTLTVAQNTMQVNGDFTIVEGSINGSISVKGNVLAGSPWTNPGSGTLALIGTNLQTITHRTNVATAVQFGSLIAANTSAAGVLINSPFTVVDIGGTFTLNSGCKFDCNGLKLTTGAAVSIHPSATFIAPPLMIMNNAGIRNLNPGGHEFNEVVMLSDEVNNYYFTLQDNMLVRSNLTITGSLQGAYRVTLAGDLTKYGDSGLVNQTFVMNGTSNQLITVTNAACFQSTLVISNAGVAALGTNLTVVGKLVTVASNGTFRLAGYDCTASSGLTNRGTLMLNGNETLTTPNLAAGSTVKYEGVAATPVTVKNWAYKGLDLSAPGRQINFTAATTHTVAERFTAVGAGGQPVVLRSTSGGSYAVLNVSPAATLDVRYVDVQDNDASPGKTILATKSTGSHTLNWDFFVPGTMITVR